MLPTDMMVLRDRLAELAEVFERKPITDKALRVWFDTLREFPVERIAGLLIGWPKTHNKFPAPAEVWKVCNEVSIDEREKKAALEKSEVAWEKSPQGAVFLKKMREVLNRPSRSPRQHWEHVLKTQPLGSIGYEHAKKILKPEDREPGSDDEPQAVNF